jgi:5'-nucleotidase
MGYDLQNKLVVGIASSALFDLTESDSYFVKHGEVAYRDYQRDHEDDILPPGVAFNFARRLLQLNDLRPADPLVELIVMSKNDPNTGLRVMNSIAAKGLPVTRAIFTRGRPPFPYMEPFRMSLFLSANGDDVRAAVEAGFAAGRVLRSDPDDDMTDTELRIAFDFDGVLGSDESEAVYAKTPERYAESEERLREVPLSPGPLEPLLADLNRIQKIEEQVSGADLPRLRIAVVTARSAPAHERAVRSLQKWGVSVDEAFFLGGIDKGPVLDVFHPHMFFDDQMANLDEIGSKVASVHIPYGIRNQVCSMESMPDQHCSLAQVTEGGVCEQA